MPHSSLTLSQILSGFPDEIEPQCKRHIARINRELKPWRSYFEQLEHQPYNRWTKDFIREAVRVCFMPREVTSHLGRCRKLINMVKKKSIHGSIGETDIARAKSVPILSLMECTRRGGKEWAKCPFHASGTEKTASFVVNTNNTGHCFSCGWHGDSIALVMKLQGLSFIEAVRWLISK